MRWYFTFGQAHVHPATGVKMRDYWIEVEAPTAGSAYDQMVAIYGLQWSMQYKEKDFKRSYFPKGCYEVLGGERQSFLFPPISIIN